jgi:drug/metabolite transporter (DMT)-like permease
VSLPRLPDSILAWYFVVVWGSGFIATKTGLQYAPPFTFLCLRFGFGIVCMLPIVLLSKPHWPRSRSELRHVAVAGLLMHAVNLGGSHYAQYLGMSAGVTALVLSVQPLLTAMIAARWLGESLRRLQWFGIAIGMAGMALVVWHKIDIRAIGAGSLVAVTTSLVGITLGTLYQRRYCPTVDLRSAALLQFAVTVLALAPLAWFVEGAHVRWAWSLLWAVAFLVLFASILAVNALHTLMRRGQATRVTSLLYLTPIVAVVLEFLLFDVVPSAVTAVGIVVTCLGVALVFWRRESSRQDAKAPRTA